MRCRQWFLESILEKTHISDLARERVFFFVSGFSRSVIILPSSDDACVKWLENIGAYLSVKFTGSHFSVFSTNGCI